MSVRQNKKTSFALLALCLLVPMSAFGFGESEVSHSVLVSSAESGAPVVKISLPANENKRVRAFVAAQEGYRVVDLERSDDRFLAEIPFTDLALLRYCLQVEAPGGRVSLSRWYEQREPGKGVDEEAIERLRQEVVRLRAERRQLESAVRALRQADPKMLSKRKSQERAKAYLALSQAERRVKMLKGRIEERLVKLQRTASPEVFQKMSDLWKEVQDG